MESVSNYVHLFPFPSLVHLSLFVLDKNAEPLSHLPLHVSTHFDCSLPVMHSLLKLMDRVIGSYESPHKKLRYRYGLHT
jgi:hypothetical protein